MDPPTLLRSPWSFYCILLIKLVFWKKQWKKKLEKFRKNRVDFGLLHCRHVCSFFIHEHVLNLMISFLRRNILLLKNCFLLFLMSKIISGKMMGKYFLLFQTIHFLNKFPIFHFKIMMVNISYFFNHFMV